VIDQQQQVKGGVGHRFPASLAKPLGQPSIASQGRVKLLEYP
jgi:hypothetical protein